ncbi:MAG TPA: WYL domain-containing protein [Acidimicrobiales bacterium]
MADQGERVTNLIALLRATRRPLTFDEITLAMPGQYGDTDAARRGNFERDKRLLREIGVPYEQAVMVGERAGATGYWIEAAKYELPDLGLTDDERRALQLAVATVHLASGGIDDALAKLGTGPADLAGPMVATLATPPAVAAIRSACRDRAAISFGYHGETRTVDVYGVLVRDGNWYVIGHDHARGERRTFRVDRIDGAVTAGPVGTYSIPEGFTTSSVLPDPKEMGEGEEVEALVLVARPRAVHVVGEVGEASVVEKRADGAVVVRVPYRNAPAFRSWVLGLLDHAEVLAPEAARSLVRDWLRAVSSAAGEPLHPPGAR